MSAAALCLPVQLPVAGIQPDVISFSQRLLTKILNRTKMQFFVQRNNFLFVNKKPRIPIVILIAYAILARPKKEEY
jgi:hypothetical protein